MSDTETRETCERDGSGPVSGYVLICHDQRRPAILSSRHGVHHWQVRLPLSQRWHLCLTLTSGRYFVAMVERREGLLRAAVPFAAMALVRRPHRPSASYMRWCAHINVTAHDRDAVLVGQEER